MITRFSTPEERQALITAFQQGQSKGLTEALSKMKSAGRIQIPGTVGYDLAYVASIATPTGRKISFHYKPQDRLPGSLSEHPVAGF